MAEPRRPLLIRLPESLFERLKTAAQADRRSLNGAIEVAVERYIWDVEERIPRRERESAPPQLNQ